MVTTTYCPVCGERRLAARDLTVRGLFEQAFQAITSLDLRLLRTVGHLLRYPGLLTVKYVEGPRKSYVGPFALFLLANVLFVAMEALTGSDVFSTPLANHLHDQPWSPWAQRMVADRMAAMHVGIGEYAPVFDKAVAENAKALVVLMALPFAVLPALLFHSSGRPSVTHVAFSLHFHAFMLLALSLAVMIPAIDVLLGGHGLQSRILDNTIAVALLLAFASYLYLSAQVVYRATGAMRILKTVLLMIASAVIMLGYRFAIFLITLYTA